MKFLVIGGAGYIGSHVVKTLCEKQHTVLVLDDLSTGYEHNIDSNATFVQGDFMDPVVLDSVMKQHIDVVIHLAALKAAGESMIHPDTYAKHNISGSISIVSSMVEHHVKLLVFSSSAAVYGLPDYLPMDEKHPTNPESFYGYTKLSCEDIFAWFSKLKGIKLACLRYFNAAGYATDGSITGQERNPQNLLPLVMEVANGTRDSLVVFGNDYDTDDGSCIRDYVHVTDLAQAHSLAAEYIQDKGNITVNLGSEHGYSVLDVLKQAEQITGKPINHTIGNRREGDPEKVVASAAFAKETLGWRASFSDMNTILSTMWAIYK